MDKKSDEIFGEEPSKKHNIWGKKSSKTEDKKNKPRVWDKELDIKLKPWHLLKGLFIVALFVGVFFLGRFSMDMPELGLSGLAVGDSVELAEEEEEVPEEPAAEEVKEEVKEEEPPAEVVEEEPEEEEEEVIVTKYSKVALSITKPVIDWKGTWGKITGLQYTIKNSEVGTIKPGYIVMTVDGYHDVEKNAPIPKASWTIKKGEKHSGVIIIPNGFAYNEKTAGSLDSVGIKIYLYDENDKVMTVHQNSFDLRG